MSINICTYFHICSLADWCDRRLWASRMHSWSCSGDTFPAAFGCTDTLDLPPSPLCSMRHCGRHWDVEGKRLALLRSREPMHSSCTGHSPPLRIPTPAARRCSWLHIACCTPWVRKAGDLSYTTGRLTSLEGRMAAVDVDEGGCDEDWSWPRLLLKRTTASSGLHVPAMRVPACIQSGGGIFSPGFTWHRDP